MTHAPSEPVKIPYPSAKDDWYRIHCLASDCDYAAWGSVPEHMVRSAQSHADAENNQEKQ